ncbi:hypothetical protein [Micromonospora sp. WMMC273]|uniref:hypothetical protein n=1 Tax=Micromonospora sp. WMMC273 TaxID=3015157 RepID=UPI0022B6F061|nr:hypothetical protein [Micromonospora sp. WMMC273]MCZ7478879.1 hypothetical protein [Micromonospora sp. WMMC273]
MAGLGAVGGGFITAGVVCLGLWPWFADWRWGATGGTLMAGGVLLVGVTGAWRV